MTSYSQKGFGWPHVLLTLVLLFIIAGLCTPLILVESKVGSRAEALNNAKAIAGGLITFKTDLGAYPCAYTRRMFEHDGLKLPAGTDANAYLAQLIVTEVIDSETYFYAPGMPHCFKGDDLIGSPEKLLAPGENGFAYIMAENEEPLTDVKSITPLVIAPIATNGKIPTFDPEPYTGYYVYGSVDGSGKQGKINTDGSAGSKGRTSLFQTGEDSLFGDDIPVIKMPREGKITIAPSPKDWSYALLLIPLAAFFWWACSPPKKAPPEEPTPESE